MLIVDKGEREIHKDSKIGGQTNEMTLLGDQIQIEAHK